MNGMHVVGERHAAEHRTEVNMKGRARSPSGLPILK
jgi:hypothetical protein